MRILGKIYTVVELHCEKIFFQTHLCRHCFSKLVASVRASGCCIPHPSPTRTHIHEPGPMSAKSWWPPLLSLEIIGVGGETALTSY